MTYRFRILAGIQASGILPGRWRNMVLRRMGIEVGERAFVAPGVSFTARRVRIGTDAFINAGVIVDAAATITIEPHVHIGFGASLLTAAHAIGGPARRAGEPTAGPIRIGAGSWIGGGAIILPGVSIAPGCVVGAGAVVTHDTAANGVYVGVPARRVRDLDR